MYFFRAMFDGKILCSWRKTGLYGSFILTVENFKLKNLPSAVKSAVK